MFTQSLTVGLVIYSKLHWFCIKNSVFVLNVFPSHPEEGGGGGGGGYSQTILVQHGVFEIHTIW